MWMVIGMTSIGVFIVSIIGTLVCLFSKNHNWKKWLAIAGVFLVLIFVAISSDIAFKKENKEAYDNAKALFDQSRYSEAIVLFEQVNEKSPLYAEASNLILESKKRIDEALINQGKAHLSNGKFNEAIIILGKINSRSFYYPESLELALQARGKLADAVIDEGKALLTKGDFLGSIEKFKNVPSDLQQYQSAQLLIKEANDKHAQKLFTECKALVSKNDFDGASAKLDEALSINPSLIGGTDYYKEIDKKRAAYLAMLQQKEIDDYKNSCKTIEYKVLDKNPDSFAGTRIKLRGEIMQIMENYGSTFLLLQVTYNSYGYGYGSWDDSVAIFFDGTFDAYEDDIITVWGEVKGSYSYESVAGYNITIPSVNAKHVQYPKH